MTWEKFVDKAFYAMILGSVTYGVSQIRTATDSINELNTKVSVVIEQIANQSKIIESHEQRILYLERKGK